MNNPQRGSALVLVLIAVLLLSLIGIAGLENTGLETQTNRSFMEEAQAFYAAESGINAGLNQMKNTLAAPSTISFQQDFGKYTIYSGRITDTAPQGIRPFLGFNMPPPKGMSIESGGELGMVALPWRLTVSSKSKSSSYNTSRKQIEVVVVSMSTEY